MNNLKKRCLTLLLSLAMIVTYMPTSLIAYAEAEDETDPVQVEQQVDAEEPAAEVTSNDAAPEEAQAKEDVKSKEAAPEEKSEDVAAPEEKTEDAVSKEKTEDAASPEKESPEDVDKPADDGKGDEQAEAEKSDEKAEDKEPLVFTKDLEKVAVKVTAPVDTFSEDVELVVKQLDKTDKEDKEAFEEAEKALADNKQTYDGILAFDIHFKNAAGDEVEPVGAVSVEMTAKKEALKGVDPEAIDKDSIQVTLIGSDKATVVADNADKKVKGTVEIQTAKKAVEQINAEFEAEEFSTCTITWREKEEEASEQVEENAEKTTEESAEAPVGELTAVEEGSYKITVKYDENAGIPEGAELKVKEIEAGGLSFWNYNRKAQKAVGNTDEKKDEDEKSDVENGEPGLLTILSDLNETSENSNDLNRFFDISIMVDGKEIEPDNSVNVTIEYEDIGLAHDEKLEVVHFADSGIEVIQPEVVGNEVVFEQDSFSVTGTVVTAPSNDNEYSLLVDYEGAKYEVMYDGTLQEVTPVSGTNNQYTVNMAEVWTWTNNRLRVRRESDYEYLDPLAEAGRGATSRTLTRTSVGNNGYTISNSNNVLDTCKKGYLC